MDRVRVAVVAATMTMIALAGCAADPEPVPQIDEPVEDLPVAGTLLHVGNVSVGTSVLGNLSIPVGVMGHTGFDNFEPTLGVTSDGALFMSASHGGIGAGFVSVIRSTDQGATWEPITPTLGTLSTPPTTFDPYVHVDQDTDRIFNLDMEGLNCNYIQWSDDGGDSFTGHPLGCGQPPVLDHPTLFTGTPRMAPTVGYDNVVYLCVNRVADAACATSFNGGLSFDVFRPVFTPVDPNGESPVGGACGGLTGHGVTDFEGRAYLGRIHCGGIPTVAMSDDDGLTWTTSPVSQQYTSHRHDVELATDAAGNVYALWVDDDWDLRLATSMDHGATWSEAIAVAAPGIETAVFPSIAAGDEGKVALVYYGTDVDILNDDIEKANWTAYLATIPDALAAEPVIASAAITPADDPIAVGACDDDNRCNGVGDFIDIVIDMEGRPWAALFDSGPSADGEGELQGAIGTLREGFPLRGDGDALPVLDVVLE